MQRLVTTFAMLAAFGLPLLPSNAHAQVSALLAQKSPDATELADIAGKTGYVRIIVEFPGPVPADQLRPEPAQLASVKQQIAAMQDAIVASHFGSATNPLPGHGFQRGLLRFAINPMFAVNVTRTELEALAADPRIVRVHLDRPSPPLLLQSVPLIGMPKTYGFGATGAGQGVAVLDTGVQSKHEFLAGKVVMEACFSNSGGGGGGVSLCPDGQPKETGTGAADPTRGNCIAGDSNLCTHGTHVAGIAAGKTTNAGDGKPSNGVARDAKIVAVQVFTRFDDAAHCKGQRPCVLTILSDQISAFEWVFQHALIPSAGAKLASVNMSLGSGKFTGNCDNSPLKPSIDLLKGVGVATVIAAGNNGFTDAISTPACISTAVAVGSTDKTDNISNFSNMAPLVKLVAPGGLGMPGDTCAFGAKNADILSSIPGPLPTVTQGYWCFPGTSMATPHVAGAFAAIRTACPHATVDQILAALEKTGKPINDTRHGGTQTKPRIEVDLAVQEICVKPADLAITMTAPKEIGVGTTLTYSLDVINKGPSNATNVVVTDILPPGATFRSSSILSCGGEPLVCRIGDLADAKSAPFTITVDVSVAVPGQTEITNTARVTGDQPDNSPKDNTASATTLVTN